MSSRWVLGALILASAPLGGCGTPASESPSKDDIARFATTMQELDQTRTQYGIPGLSIAIVLDGRLAFSGAVGVSSLQTGEPVTPVTLFLSPVAERTLLAATLLDLEQDGSIDLKRSVHDYAPFVDLGAESNQVSTELALEHRTGLAQLDSRESCDASSGSLEHWFTQDGQIPAYVAPGAVFLSNTTGLALGAAVIEGVSQRPFSEVVAERMLQPMDMTTATFDANTAESRQHALGHLVGADGQLVERDIHDIAPRECEEWQASVGLFASARDHAQALVSLLSEQGPLQPESIDEMEKKLTDPGWGTSFGYGYLTVSTEYKGVHLVSQSANAFGYQGYVDWVPERKFGVVILSNGAGDVEATRATNLLMYSIVDRFLGLKAPDPDDSTPPSTWSKYVGSYQDPTNPDYRFDVVQDASGQLSATTPLASGAVALSQGYPDRPFTGGDTFVANSFDGTFFQDASGTMQYFAGHAGNSEFVAQRVK